MKFRLLNYFPLPFLFVSALGQNTTVVVPIVPPNAATADQSAASSVTDYSDEPFVLEQSNTSYKMASDGTGSRLTSVVVRVQSEAAAKQLGIVYVGYASGSEHVEFSYVRVRRP